jgi:tripartite-type tricarboxylate transporter receptor subunit TctC
MELGYQYTSFPSVNGVAGPPGLAAAKVTILEAAFAQAAREPDFITWSKRTGTELDSKDSRTFTKLTEDITREVVKYSHLLGK